MNMRRELGIGPDADKTEIRRAYARRLKETHPEDDPEGFQRLREAYETAMRHAEFAARGGATPDIDGAAGPAAENKPPPTAKKRPKPAGVPDRSPPPRNPEPAADEAIGPAIDEAVDPAVDHETRDDGQALEELAEHIRDLLDRDDEAAAIAALETAMGDPLLLNLTNRRHFELWLLEELGGREPPPQRVVGAAIDMFRWDEHRTDLPDGFRYAADRVMRTRMAGERLAELRRDARRKWTQNHSKAAAGLLLGRYRPAIFTLAAMAANTMTAMAELLEELRDQYPSILEDEVDPRVLAWWTDAVENPGRSSGRLTWIVIGLSFLIGLTQVLVKNS